MNICIYGASSNAIDEKYIKSVEELGEYLAKEGHSLIFGGGAAGLMGAAARGFKMGGGKVTGVAPSFFNVDGVFFDKCDDFILTETMRERKQKMEELSDAFLAVPGGPGTFDEFFEMFTLRQLDRHTKPIALYNIFGYYDSLVEFMRHVSSENFMKEKNLHVFGMLYTPKEVCEYFSKETERINIHDLKNI